MQVVNPLVKRYIWDIVALSNEVDEKGKRIPRASFVRQHYAGAVNARRKIVETFDIGVKDEKGEEKTMTFLEAEKAGVLGGEHTEIITNRKIEFDKKEIDAIKFYSKITDEFADYGIEAFEQLEELLK